MGNISKINVQGVSYDVQDAPLTEQVGVIYEVTAAALTKHEDEINALAEVADWAEGLPWNEDAEWLDGRETPVQSDWNETNNTSLAYIKNKPTIPEPYSLPVASAGTLGGVKVGSGLGITRDGVLSWNGQIPQQYCIVYLDNVNIESHTANIRSDSPTSSTDLRAALSNGMPIVAIEFDGDSKLSTWTCYGANLSDPGAIAVFSHVDYVGQLRYVNIYI